MPVFTKSANIDRYQIDTSFDLTPIKTQEIFQSANGGTVKRQSRLANELTEKDAAIAQAWSVRVAAIAACPWEIVGPNQEQADTISRILKNIQPSYNDELVSFNKLLKGLQASILHGFSVAQTEWINGGSNIQGFKLYSQSLFSYANSELPFFQGPDGEKKITPFFPRWIYHTSTNARETEPLRSGLVRPLAYLYTFRRHVLIEYLRGIEKYGLPLIQAIVERDLWEDSAEKAKIEDALGNMTYDGYMITPKDELELNFPVANSAFDVAVFDQYLQYSERQIFRLILGQDSTSSSDNSNRSTAQVHNLVRADMLASDANSVQETVNNQIIKPLYSQLFGASNDRPAFRFRLKGTKELQDIATVMQTLTDAGYQVDEATLSERLGFKVTKTLVADEGGVRTPVTLIDKKEVEKATA